MQIKILNYLLIVKLSSFCIEFFVFYPWQRTGLGLVINIISWQKIWLLPNLSGSRIRFFDEILTKFSDGSPKRRKKIRASGN